MNPEDRIRMHFAASIEEQQAAMAVLPPVIAAAARANPRTVVVVPG